MYISNSSTGFTQWPWKFWIMDNSHLWFLNICFFTYTAVKKLYLYICWCIISSLKTELILALSCQQVSFFPLHFLVSWNNPFFGRKSVFFHSIPGYSDAVSVLGNSNSIHHASCGRCIWKSHETISSLFWICTPVNTARDGIESQGRIITELGVSEYSLCSWIITIMFILESGKAEGKGFEKLEAYFKPN